MSPGRRPLPRRRTRGAELAARAVASGGAAAAVAAEEAVPAEVAPFVETLDAWIGSVRSPGRQVTVEDMQQLQDIGKGLDNGLRTELKAKLRKIADAFRQLVEECFPQYAMTEELADVTRVGELDTLPSRKHHEADNAHAAERIFSVIQDAVECVESLVGVKSSGAWQHLRPVVGGEPGEPDRRYLHWKPSPDRRPLPRRRTTEIGRAHV